MKLQVNYVCRELKQPDLVSSFKKSIVTKIIYFKQADTFVNVYPSSIHNLNKSTEPVWFHPYLELSVGRIRFCSNSTGDNLNPNIEESNHYREYQIFKTSS